MQCPICKTESDDPLDWYILTRLSIDSQHDVTIDFDRIACLRVWSGEELLRELQERPRS